MELHGGTIDTITGDGACAVFGVPIVHEDDALRAVRAAGEARSRLTLVSERLAADQGANLELRIAVSTGAVVTGGPTSTQVRVTGEPLTLSSRLAQAADPGDVVLDEATSGSFETQCSSSPSTGRPNWFASSRSSTHFRAA